MPRRVDPHVRFLGDTKILPERLPKARAKLEPFPGGKGRFVHHERLDGRPDDRRDDPARRQAVLDHVGQREGQPRPFERTVVLLPAEAGGPV